MREYSVSLRKSEFAVASDAPMNTCAPGKAQGISKQAATVVPSEYVEIITADFYNQENDFIIKKEDKVFKSQSNKNSMLAPRSCSRGLHSIHISYLLRPIRRRRGPARVRGAKRRRHLSTVLSHHHQVVKVEDHHYENSREGYVDSNYWQVSNTGLYVDGQKYECEYCGFTTNIDVDFVKSIRSRMNKKSYKCHLCEYNASQLSHLQSHMRKHTGEKPYKCNYCEYSASQFCSLQRHTRRHTGEKPYKCKQCDYSTSYLYSLQTHMRTHTGEKPYKCVHCEYSASESSKLKRHMRLHTGEKPYKCKQCDYSTSRLNYLKTHMRRHTGENRIVVTSVTTTHPNWELKRHMLCI
ncbi:Zinc finger protein 235 [Eumeta japonica]|uniref:Zinc finger protein 235 n=1 Tax=Eumeta variegata TaxID=151549 RepID=A0A4C1WW16_EUMVA|nr:Zinc finger protein 235 [Eumeta japonica]